MASTRILIADDHEIFRRRLRSLIDACPNWEICGEASNGLEAVEAARKLQPDIVIMDLSMPQVNGLDAMKQILGEKPKTRVMILSQHDSAYMFAAEDNRGNYVESSFDCVEVTLPPGSAAGNRLTGNDCLLLLIQGFGGVFRSDASRRSILGRDRQVDENIRALRTRA